MHATLCESRSAGPRSVLSVSPEESTEATGSPARLGSRLVYGSRPVGVSTLQVVRLVIAVAAALVVGFVSLIVLVRVLADSDRSHLDALALLSALVGLWARLSSSLRYSFGLSGDIAAA